VLSACRDVAAELEANRDTFAQYRERARKAGAVIVPAMAFFGGLGDLPATAAMGDWAAADEAHIAYALSSWHPTAGTRRSGAVSRERRGDVRLRYSGGQWERRSDAAPVLEWTFPEPVGVREVIGEFTMADVVTVPQHLSIPDVTTYMTVEAVRDLAAPHTPVPTAADRSGRSDQTFLVDAVVRSGGVERRATASGQDIYAVTAPLVAEALERVLTGRTKTVGVASAGEIFDAPDFLHALAPNIALDLHPQGESPHVNWPCVRDLWWQPTTVPRLATDIADLRYARPVCGRVYPRGVERVWDGGTSAQSPALCEVVSCVVPAVPCRCSCSPACCSQGVRPSSSGRRSRPVHRVRRRGRRARPRRPVGGR